MSSNTYRPQRGGNQGYSESQRFNPYGSSDRNGGNRDRRGGGGYGNRNGGGGGGFGGRRGGFGGGRSQYETQPLVPIDWSTRELEKLEKNFSHTLRCEKTEKETIDAWRKEHSITISVGFPQLSNKARNKGRKRWGRDNRADDDSAIIISEEVKSEVRNTAPIINFDHAGFPRHVLNAINKAGFEKPTPIQSQSWPLILAGKDVIGIARTGSGKTVAFLLPVFTHMAAQRSLRRGDGPICVVIAPTRELAQQICTEAKQFTGGSGIRVSMICGGMPKGPQIRELRNGVEILVLTPGRAIDFLESGLTNFDRVSYLVIDEADRLLDMGFEPSLKTLVSQIRPDRQTLFFSATWPKEVHELARQFLDDNEENICQIGVGQNEDGTVGDLKANPNVLQKIEFVSGIHEKQDLLKKYLPIKGSKDQMLVFVATKKLCDRLGNDLWQSDFAVDCIHGDKSQPARDMALRNFKNGRVNILVATDVASRGIHVDDLATVLNFDFPGAIEDYVHRIGRTGRAGKKGTAVSFFNTASDGGRAKELIKILKTSDQEVPEQLTTIARNVGHGSKRNRYSRFGGGGRFGGGRRGGRW